MKRNFSQAKNKLRKIRHVRVRAIIKGTAERPRLSVFRGLKNMNLQLIDDTKGNTLCEISTVKVTPEKVEGKEAKVSLAYLAGKKLAELAKAKKISQIVFDRGGYRYHGRVAAVAEGARDGGLQF
ncbi:MAG: 50S ribosomal protein L18 [Candidatus Magasanikbacteria bacterium]|nr:50S ribosomal protein L18 [Candidatus Magasanikbacteria bacterium]